MVIGRHVWIPLAFFLFNLMGLLADVKVTATLDQSVIPAGQPIGGKIEIMHDPQQEVDLQQVKMGQDPLQVSLFSSAVVGNQKLTILKFSLPPRAKGLYALPSLSVKVGGQLYTTVSQSFTVDGNNSSPSKAGSSGNYGQTDSIWLKLESYANGKTTLYPGQRTAVGYRYYFNGNMQLTDETLPLLEAEGFKKIGELEIKDYKVKRFAVRQIEQQIEALKPGEYHFAEANVSGFVYHIDAQGQQQAGREIQAVAPGLTLTVLSFPDEKKPASFNGAIGNFTFKVRLLSLAEISVGDKLTLSIEITGKGDLEAVPMPEVCCQPGFSGQFKQSDIPPVGVIKDDTKAFVVDLRPLSDKIKEVPSLEFSFFNPETSSYQVLHSEPIPITVHPSDEPFNKALQSQPPATPPISTPTSQDSVSAIEISGNVPLTSSDLYDRSFGSGWVLVILPVGLVALWLQIQMKHWNELHSRVQAQQNSENWLAKAYASQDDLSKVCHSLERAFISLLREKGVITNEDLTPEQLSQEGISGDVRAFLCQIEESRFAKQEKLSSKEVLGEAQRLYDDIKRSRVL